MVTDRPAQTLGIPEALYPFAPHYHDVAGRRMHYLDEGEGPPVVMVHGNPTWSFYYRDLVNALRDRYRCVVPDHIGCGLSDKPDDASYSYRLEQRVADLTSLIDTLEPERPVTLVVHDWGGMIGMAWATRHPDRVARLVILNTSAFPLPETKRFPWPLWIVRNTAIGAYLVQHFNAFSAVAARVSCTRTRPGAAVRRAYQAPYDSPQHRIATLRFVQDIPLRPSDPSYPIVREVANSVAGLREKPMLICWGMRDFVFDEHFLRLWETHFPDASVHRFADCGHYILEDATDEVVPLITRFLETT